MSEPPPDDQPPEETLDDLYDHAPCGYVTLDSRLRVVRINATLLSWLGVGKADVVGRKIQDVLTPAGRIFFRDPCVAASSQGGRRPAGRH
ncbi:MULTISPECIES: PAS domain-containing protein [Sphingobium]|uniref:PAS domain-containing protein n=1 Tax=Sphingobium yanoikuyae TaxID=13690 RepID=A0A6M4GFS2_SPHYA|nr:PAS domain-containing protein [Sphingobium yanoikuyae]QJR06015.1 PAS domain-containing protein [Sphingobium yanoikuyae]